MTLMRMCLASSDHGMSVSGLRWCGGSGLGIAVPLASKAEEELSDGAGSVGVEASAIGNTGPESAKGDRAEPYVFCSGETPDSGVLGTNEDGVLGADKVVGPGLGCTGEDDSFG
ncbi:hypothetical protein FCV25MIE_13921 [Fagus crenata]